MQTIKLDLSCYEVPQSILAKQADVGRKFQAQLTDRNQEFIIPEGAVLSVWYSGTSGTGNYTSIGQRSAFEIDGSTVTVEMITQMLTNKGSGKLCIVLNDTDGTQIGMWNIPYIVEEVPGIGSAAARQYYTALSETVGETALNAKAAQEAAAVAVNSVHSELLWTNESKASAMEPQTITLPDRAKDFDAFLLMVNVDINIYHTIPVLLRKEGIDGAAVAHFPECSSGNKNWLACWRYFFIENDGVSLTISDGYVDGSVANNCAIPYKVFGIRL